MNELRRKTFLTIYAILTAILVTALVLINIRNYNMERGNIERILNILDERGGMRNGERTPEAGGMDGRMPGPRDPNNMMVMDYEAYTVVLDDKYEIETIYSHGNEADDFDITNAAEEIKGRIGSMNITDPGQERRDSIFIGNLYRERYSYKYRYGDTIVIINNNPVREKLMSLLAESALILVIMDLVIYFVSRLITGWITKPADEAFSRQKEFIADASHELKTPLAVIMASADEISAGTSSEDPGRKYIDNILYESDRMNSLIAGLLNLSKLEDGNVRDTYKEENISRIIEKTCLAYEAVAYEQDVAIQTDIDENMNLVCSRNDIEKMVSTILDNAVKHSYRDTTVRVSAHPLKGGTVIKIINKGDPIKEEDRERIFERFYRADKSRERSSNRYGLGLAIARRIARNHKGDIKAFSADGDTTFEITLHS